MQTKEEIECEGTCEHPIKKCHFLEGKYFVVIDQSIINRLDIFRSKETELYFEQEAGKDNSIILRYFKIGSRTYNG